MASDLWRRLLWQIAGVICYLLGLLIFLVVAIDVFTSPPEGSLANFSWEHIALIAASLVLMLTSGGILYRHRSAPMGMLGSVRGNARTGMPGGTGRLEQFERPAPDETGDPSADVGSGVRCPSCGASNESGYRFCRSCSSELS